MDDPFQLILIVRFDGQDISPVSQGDELFLEEGLPLLPIQEAFENCLNLLPGSLQLMPELRQGRTCLIEDLALGAKGVKDCFLKALLVG